MITAAGRNRHAARDKALILICYRHGLRVGELVALEWAHVDFPTSLQTVRRSKHGLDSTHPLTGRELRALWALQRQARTRFVLESERGMPMSVRAAQWIVEQAGRDAKLPLPVHNHMLRHSCGYKLMVSLPGTFSSTSVIRAWITRHAVPPRHPSRFMDSGETDASSGGVSCA